jgi:uncharacterized protein (TIGR03083 family)
MNSDRLASIDALMAKIEDRARGLPTTNPIRTCPGWTVTDLTEHLVAVLVRMQLRIETNRNPDPAAIPTSPPEGMDMPTWLSSSYQSLRHTFLAHDVDDPAWNWTGKDQHVGWYLRRLTHELAIHLVDYDTASASPTPPTALGIDATLATDGIDELLSVFLASRAVEVRQGVEHKLLMLNATDSTHAPWFIELEGDHITLLDQSVGEDARVDGPSVDLYLFGWNRPAPNLTISGDHDTVELFGQIPR